MEPILANAKNLNKRKRQCIFFIIAILALIGAVYAVARKKPIPTITIIEEEKTATGISIPKEVHVYNGRVEEAGDGYLVMRSLSAGNYLPADSLLRVSFDKKTEFVKKSAPQTVSPETAFITVTEEQAASEDVAPGALVVVYSSDNIKGDLKFPAERVVIIK